MKLSDVMENPRLKVERANSHIDALIHSASTMPQNLYEITNGPHWSHALLAKPDGFALAYRPKQPIPKAYGAIMGDAVNNLREALEYWIRNASECVGPRKRLQFPFSEFRKDLESSKGYGPVERAFPDAANFIAKHIEPCRDTNLHLWAAASLCNGNKHDDFIPVATVSRIHGGLARSGGITFAENKFGTDANRPFVIAHLPWPFSVEKDFEVSADIVFPKGAVFEDEPVIPTLTNMSQVVSQTLDALEKFIAPYCE